MPLLSRRRRAVKSFSRTAYSRFASKTIDVGYDEYVDIDDDRISNFKDVGMDDEIDVVEDVYLLTVSLALQLKCGEFSSHFDYLVVTIDVRTFPIE